MPQFRDPCALRKYAASADDPRLAELVRARLAGRTPPRSARRAFATLLDVLCLREPPAPADDRLDATAPR